MSDKSRESFEWFSVKPTLLQKDAKIYVKLH